MTSAWISGAVVLCVAAPAGATGRYAKPEQRVEVAQQATKVPAPNEADARGAPALTIQDVFRGRGDELKKVTDSQIRILERLISVTGDQDPEKPDLVFRLAELFAEQEAYYGFRAHEVEGAEQQEYQRQEKEWLLKALKKYLEVVDGPSFQSYPKMDQVLFYLSYLLTRVDKEDLARVYLKRLIKDYPQSPYLAHAYLSFAGYFFERKDFENAVSFYEKVTQYKDSPVYLYAQYCKAWVYINLKQYNEAIATFSAVVESAKDTPSQKQVAKEALKDLVRVYAKLGAAPRAVQYFSQHGGAAGVRETLQQLAERYRDERRFEDSGAVYRELIKRDPSGAKLCEWRAAIVVNALEAGWHQPGEKETARALRELAAADKQAGCAALDAAVQREAAELWHAEAQKRGNLAAYQAAAAQYRAALGRPVDAEDHQARFLYGEVLFRLGELDPKPRSRWFCDAAEAYGAAGAQADAARAAVLAWKNCLDVADAGPDEDARVQAARRARPASAKARKSQPLSERERKLLAAFDAYLAAVPDAADAAVLVYDRARVLYERNRFAEALPLFRQIVEQHGDTPQAAAAAELLADCRAFAGDDHAAAPRDGGTDGP